MQNELLVAIIAGLGGMLGWGFADFFAKKTIDRIGSIESLVWAHVFGTIALGLIVLYRSVMFGIPPMIPTNFETWSLLALFGAWQAIVYLLAYIGFGKGKLAILNPIFASYSGVAALISIIVLGEVLGLPLLLSLGIIFLGVLFLNIDTSLLHMRRINLIRTEGFREVGAAAVIAAIWTVSWGNFVSGQDWVSFAFYMYLFMTITAFIIAKVQKTNLNVLKGNLWVYLALIGFCEVIAYLSISLGFSSTTHTSIVAVLSGAFSLPTILLARLFLKEQVTTIQTIGSLVIISGIVLLSIS